MHVKPLRGKYSLVGSFSTIPYRLWRMENRLKLALIFNKAISPAANGINKGQIARRALGIVAEIVMHPAAYLVEVRGNHPRIQIEIVDQILSHF